MKNNVYPCPQFYCIKVGFKGVKLYRHALRNVRPLLIRTVERQSSVAAVPTEMGNSRACNFSVFKPSKRPALHEQIYGKILAKSLSSLG